MKTSGKHRMGCFFKSCLTGGAGLFGMMTILLAIIALLGLAFWGAGAYLIVADPIENVDAIVVLSGGQDDSRLEEAAKLFMDRKANWIILTETGEKVPGQEMLISWLQRQELNRLGVGDDVIILTEKHVSSTWSEARVVMKLMLSKGMKSCMVVTDPYHTRRTALVFSDVFKDKGVKVLVRPVIGHWYKSSTWWTSERGREVTFLEYSKLIGYKYFDMKQD